MLIQLTQEWTELWIYMMRSMITVLEIATSEWIKDIRDIKINNLLKWKIFIDQNNIPYNDMENKKIIKKLIHTFIWAEHFYIIYKSNDIDYIMSKINETIKKLEGNI